jgi:hypothetical protein
MIANGRVRGALPALGQQKTPATIPHSDQSSKEFRHRSVCAAGQPARPEVSQCAALSVNDRDFPALTGRSDAAGTAAVATRDGCHVGALVLVVIQRATHYEGVPMRCSRVESPR